MRLYNKLTNIYCSQWKHASIVWIWRCRSISLDKSGSVKYAQDQGRIKIQMTSTLKFILLIWDRSNSVTILLVPLIPLIPSSRILDIPGLGRERPPVVGLIPGIAGFPKRWREQNWTCPPDVALSSPPTLEALVLILVRRLSVASFLFFFPSICHSSKIPSACSKTCPIHHL